MGHTCAEVRAEFDKLKSKQQKRFECFNTQDSENGFFDVTFQFGKEKLHAHKHMLAGVSKPFAVMFSKRWSTKDETIKIESHSYKDFKEFIGHIYSSDCKITNENVFTMVDMAEFYDVAEVKDKCDEILSKMKVTPENVFQMFEFSKKYSALFQFQSTIKAFMIQNLSTLFGSDSFMKIKKEVLKDMVELERLHSQEEELFEAVYKWAEYQAVVKQSSMEDEIFDMNQAIKEELTEILPKICFERMDNDFLIDFVVPKGFLFPSLQDLSDILHRAKYQYFSVAVFDPNVQTLSGKLSCDPSMFSNIYDTITSVKELKSGLRQYNNNGKNDYQCWNTKIPRASKPSQLRKNNNVKYYLIFDADNDLAVKKRSQIRSKDYLLAELDGDDGFHLTCGCQIEAYRIF